MENKNKKHECTNSFHKNIVTSSDLRFLRVRPGSRLSVSVQGVQRQRHPGSIFKPFHKNVSLLSLFFLLDLQVSKG